MNASRSRSHTASTSAEERSAALCLLYGGFGGTLDRQLLAVRNVRAVAEPAAAYDSTLISLGACEHDLRLLTGVRCVSFRDKILDRLHIDNSPLCRELFSHTGYQLRLCIKGTVSENLHSGF